MANVIDLLSSSPPKVISEAPVKKKNLSPKGVFDLNLSDFDTTDGLDFTDERPAKRTRLSVSPRNQGQVREASTSVQPLRDPAFELPSDGDLLPDLPRSSPPPVLSRKQENNTAQNDGLSFSFSSSAPELSVRRSPRKAVVFDLSSDQDVPPQEDPIESSSQPAQVSRSVFSERTTNLIAGVRGRLTSKIKTKGRANQITDLDETRTGRFKRMAAEVADNIMDTSSQANPGSQTQSILSKATVKTADLEKQQQTRARADTKTAKDLEKAAERERKKLEKEEKQREKQRAADVAEVNKSKTNKKNATPEMILLMPRALKGLSVSNQVEEHMKHLEVKLLYSGADEEVNLSDGSDVSIDFGHVIRWQRKVVAEYNEDEEIWRPLLKPQVTTEDHIIVYLKAEEFVTLAMVGRSSDSGEHGGVATHAAGVSETSMALNLDTHVKRLRERYQNCKPIFLIEGLSAWHRKSQATKNRAYTAAVRAQVLEQEPQTQEDGNERSNSNETPPTAPSHSSPTATENRSGQKQRSSKTQKTTTVTTTIAAKKKQAKSKQASAVDFSAITDSTTDYLLLHLQLQNQPLQIHHTTSPSTTAAQISTFTQHLSTRPYRLAAQNANLASASFCMTTGQIRTATDPQEVFVQMLQEIQRVTPSMAYGVVNAGYQTPSSLTKAFRLHGKEMLQDVKKSTNRDGGWSDRRLGPMVSKRIYKVFMGTDPGTRDGMS